MPNGKSAKVGGRGAIAQLGERLAGSQKVAGSSPAGSIPERSRLASHRGACRSRDLVALETWVAAKVGTTYRLHYAR